MIAFGVNGNHFSVNYGNTFDFLKCEFPHLVITVSHNTVRTGITTDKIFDLLCKRRWRMNDRYDLFVCIFVDNKLVFHLQNPYCFFICLRKQNAAIAVITTLYRIIGRICETAPSKFPLNNAFSNSAA